MNNRLFGSFSVNYATFILAVQTGDTEVIDGILDAHKKGAKLDINNLDQNTAGNALQIALTRRDFDTAVKLVRAGAEPYITTKTWEDDDLCYPYGEYVTSKKSFNDIFANQPDVLRFLGSIPVIKNDATRQNSNSYKY
ncbi:MAG TPA: hypothetical protein VL360_01690 [Gammaproteobacteria bacterium]|nr:hypothetical protein [Gammaproteobacteria bacterium]